MATILLVAENFAYGPAGTLLSLARPLKEQGHELLFLGSGTAFELARFDRTLDHLWNLSPDALDFPKRGTPLFLRSDLLISVLDRSSVRLAQSLGVPVMWIDILFLWWTEIPDWLRRVDLYVKQVTLPAVRPALATHEIVFNDLREVGPIVREPRPQVARKNQALITFGGMEAEGLYRVGEESLYPYVMASILVCHVDWSRYSQVLVTGNERVISELRLLYHDGPLTFRCLEHEEYLKELESSAVFLTVGGIQSTHEAFALDTPTVFLPPSNCTQYAHILDYRASNVGLASVHFEDYFPAIVYAGRDERTEIIPEIMGVIRGLASDRSMQRNIGRRISRFVNDDDLLRRQRMRQRKYMSELPAGGLRATVALVEELLGKSA